MERKIAFLLIGIICFLSVLPAVAADPETDGFSFSKWIGEGMDFLTEQVTAGWNLVSDEAESGWNQVKEKGSEWAGVVDAYVKEHQWDKRVEEAWNTLKEAAENRDLIPEEKLTEAYHTVRDWLAEHQDEIDQTAASAVDNLAGALGVEEARVSAWYRVVEKFMTENAPLTTQAVRNAWGTIKQSYGEAETVEREKLELAFETVGIWLESLDSAETESAAEALDSLKENSAGEQ